MIARDQIPCTALAAALILLASLPSCAGRGDGTDDTEPQVISMASIEIENQNFYDARIYLLRSGNRISLGQVPGNSTRVFDFDLPPHDLRVEVSFVGAGSFVTHEQTVTPGDELLLVLMPGDHRFQRRSLNRVGTGGA